MTKGEKCTFRRVEYNIFICEDELITSFFLYVFFLVTTFLRDVLSLSKRDRIWLYTLCKLKSYEFLMMTTRQGTIDHRHH